MKPEMHAGSLLALWSGAILALCAAGAWAQDNGFGWGATPPAAKSSAKREAPAKRSAQASGKPGEQAPATKAVARTPTTTETQSNADAAHPVAPTDFAAPAPAPAPTVPPSVSRDQGVTAESRSSSPAPDPTDAARQAAQEWKQRRETLLSNQPRVQ